MLAARLRAELAAWQRAGLSREETPLHGAGRLINYSDRQLVNFASNDYLGLGSDPQVAAILAEEIARHGSSGRAARLCGASSAIVRQAEEAYAAYFGYEDCLFCSSGYQAGLGLLAGLLRPGDRILIDKGAHASLFDGLKLAGADFATYRSAAQLERRLNAGTALAVVTETVFSMDGRRAKLALLEGLRRRAGFTLIADEAHSFGALGPGGRGLAAGCADVALGTFGKALGLFGAFILLPRLHRDYLLNHARPLTHTTALPAALAAAALRLLPLIEQADERRARLKHSADLFRAALKAQGLAHVGQDHIVAVPVGAAGRAAAIKARLVEGGYLVMAARYPTVAFNHALIRISLSALHSDQDVTGLAVALTAALEETP